MGYDNREDTEYCSRGGEYRILSDEMKIIDNEFQAGRGAKTGNAAEERQPLQKRMRRFRVLMSTLFLAASTAVISGGAPKKEALPQETVIETVENSETAVNEETVEETQAVQADGVVLSESEKAYLDSLAKALADQDYEQAKTLIDDPQLKTIYFDRYEEGFYIYAEGKCYLRDEFTGTGLWIDWGRKRGELDWPMSGWIQLKEGVAYDEGVFLDHVYFEADSHAYTWYAGQFKDNWANGQGVYLDEYYREDRLTDHETAQGVFRNGQLDTGNSEMNIYGVGGLSQILQTVKDNKIVKSVEYTPEGDTVITTAEDYTEDSVFSLNDISVDD